MGTWVKRRQGPIVFCATGVNSTLGGIATANRNVLPALQRLAAEADGRMLTLALSETEGQGPDYRVFAGSKPRFALATLGLALRARLMVFDHVQLAAPVMMLPRALRPVVVILAHGSEATWRIRPSSVRSFRQADRVLTNSHYTLSRMRESVGDFAGEACPLGLSPQFVILPKAPAATPANLSLTAADGAERPLGDQALLLVSRLDASEREKGHRELIEAMPAALARHPNAQLVLVGAGTDLEPLRALAAGSPAAGAIFLPGRMVAEELARIYSAAYAYVMPSRQEGFGLAYLEAMNFAKPCLACRDDGGGEVVVDGETGVLIPRKFTPGELTGALHLLLDDRARARRLGEAGWRRLVENYTSAAHQKRVYDAVRPLVT